MSLHAWNLQNKILIYIYIYFLVVRSFQSSICVVFLSYWRDLSKHVVLDLMSSSFLFVFFVFLYLVVLGKTYDVSPYDSQRSHPSMDLGVKWDLCVLFVQTAVNCQDCKFVWVKLMMEVRDLLYRRLLWVWETCHTLSLFFLCPVLFYLSFLLCHIWRCERPVIL